MLAPGTISVGELERFSVDVLERAGMRRGEADVVAHYLVEADLRGVSGHGVLRLLQYVASIEGGEINLAPEVRVVRRSSATALVDADGGYGFAPAQLAMQLAVSVATESGVGAVGVQNSHHFGMAAVYALQAAEAGFIGIALSNTMAVLPAPGGLTAVVGNDPIAIAAPRGEEAPVFVDLALSEASWGKISHAAARGEPIPAGWALDAKGRETTDAAAALAANLLVPIGAHKGFALAVLLELLAGALTGSPVGPAADGHSHRAGGCGHLLIALDPERFGGAAVFGARVEELVTAITESPTVSGESPRMPGARSTASRVKRLASGVPVPNDVRAALNELALRFEVEAL